MARVECARAVIGIVTALMVLASDGRLSVAASGDGETTLPVPRFVTLHADRVNLRTGPGAGYQLVAVLPQGTLVLVMESDPGGAWLRVTTADDAQGFVQATQVSPDVMMDALKDVGGFGRAAPKKSD